MAMAYFVWVNPVLFEFYSKSGKEIAAVTFEWSYEIFEENQRVEPYPNYWLIGGFYGVVMVWVVALLTYSSRKAQLYSTFAFVGILIAYGIEIQITYWVYQSKYYSPSAYTGKMYWGTSVFYLMAIFASMIALYLHKGRKAS
jgi:hypothetical protein